MPTLRGATKRGGNSQRVAAGLGLSIASFKAADDAGKLAMLQDLQTRTKIDDNQNDDIVQRWLNAIGWADRKPEVVADEQALQAAKFSGDVMYNSPELFHSDAPQDDPTDAKPYADQYFGAGRHYASHGYFGGGTYFADNWRESLPYMFGNRSGYMFRGLLKSNAKIVNEATLGREWRSFTKKYPKAAKYIQSHTSKNNYLTIMATMSGHNVIHDGDSYYTILDRSATVVARKGYHGSSFGVGRSGSYKNPWKT